MQAIVSVPKAKIVQKLALSEIGLTRDRFFIEGKALNVYGTYDSAKDYWKHLKFVLADALGFDTVTLILERDRKSVV